MCLEADSPSPFAKKASLLQSRSLPRQMPRQYPRSHLGKGKKTSTASPSHSKYSCPGKGREKGTKESRPGTNTRGSERQSLVQDIKIKGTDAPNSPRASRPTIHLKTQMGTYSGAGEVAQPSSSLNDPSLFPEPTKIK